MCCIYTQYKDRYTEGESEHKCSKCLHRKNTHAQLAGVCLSYANSNYTLCYFDLKALRQKPTFPSTKKPYS